MTGEDRAKAKRLRELVADSINGRTSKHVFACDRNGRESRIIAIRVIRGEVQGLRMSPKNEDDKCFTIAAWELYP